VQSEKLHRHSQTWDNRPFHRERSRAHPARQASITQRVGVKEIKPVEATLKEESMTDTEFTARLTAYLAQFSEGQKSTVPLFKKDNGSIDRNKTLALPCYAGFHLEQ
jgi:hypothetical protein